MPDIFRRDLTGIAICRGRKFGQVWGLSSPSRSHRKSPLQEGTHLDLRFRSFRVIRCLSQCVSPKIAILPHFCFPWGRSWGNHAKCCMDGKRIRCLQISRCMCPSSYNSFWDRARCWSKIVIFFIPPSLHRWKDTSMLTKPLAPCPYLQRREFHRLKSENWATEWTIVSWRFHPLTCPRIPNSVRIGCALPDLFRKYCFSAPK